MAKSNLQEIYQIKVTLLGTTPAIWRRVLVPSDMTLHGLHGVLQVAMGWDGEHLHEFRAGKQTYGPPELGAGAFGQEGLIDESEVRLDEVLRRAGSKVTYHYDFGDDWEHSVELEKRLPAEAEVRYPVCVGGERACPPEDCGGAHGFHQLLESMKDPEHERYGELLEWVGEDWEAAAFSVEEVNRALQPKGRRRG